MESDRVSDAAANRVLAELREMREFLKRHLVRRIGLFGSFARGEQTATSDVDFLVELERPDFDNFMELAFGLEERLGRRVELITDGNLSPYIRPFVEPEVRWYAP